MSWNLGAVLWKHLMFLRKIQREVDIKIFEVELAFCGEDQKFFVLARRKDEQKEQEFVVLR